MRILFFTPYGGRNGAEMMLSYLINSLPKEKFQFELFLGEKGGLIKEISGIKYHVSKRDNKPFFKLIDKALKIVNMSFFEQQIMAVQRRFKADIWYINTIHMPEVCALAQKSSIPYVVHFHDLLFQYEKIQYDELRNMIENARLLVGCAQEVCDKLKLLGGRNVALQYECIDLSRLKLVEDKIRIREQLGIKKERFVWVMSGTINYRKGADLIPQIGEMIGDEGDILWLGDNQTGLKYFIEKDIEYRKLKNIHFVGSRINDYYDYLSIADGFLLTSREDPFPLVMIEGAALGKPIVAFNSGGVKEFLRRGMGIVVDLFDTALLVDAMIKIQKNEIEFDINVTQKRALEFDAKEQVKVWEKMMLKEFNI